MYRYKTYNGPMPTAAAQLKVTTGTSIKTMLQIAPPSTIHGLTVVSWGFSVDGSASSNARVELLETDVAATVTAHVASGIVKLDGNVEASKVTLGTTATGYTSTGEGSIAATRVFDYWELPTASTNSDVNWRYQFMPDERPIVNAGKFLRVRATFAVAASMVCWVVWDE